MSVLAGSAGVRERVRRAAPMGVPALAAFSAVAVGAGLGRSLVTTYLPVLLERIRDAPGLIGTVMLVNTVAGFVVPLVIGGWSDRLRRHGHGRTVPVVLGGTLLAAGGLLAIAVGHATSYLALALLAAVAYIGLNAVTTGHRALIPQTFGDAERASATAGEEVAMLVGTLAGVVVGGVLVEIRPWAPFVLGAAVLPVLAVPTVRRMRGREAPPPPAAAEAGEVRGVRAYARAAARPGVRNVLAAQTLWVVGYVGLPPFFILYADRVLGLRASSAALILAAFGLATGVAMVAAGAVRPAHQRRVLVAGVLLMAVGMVAVSAGTSLATVAPGLVPVAVGFGVVTTLGFPVFSAFIPPGEEGAYSALYFSARSVASAVALPVAGWSIAASGSYRTLFVLGGAATLAAALPLLRLRGGSTSPALRALAERAALLAAATCASLAAVQYVHRTELQEVDEYVLELVRGLGTTPQLIDDLLVDPHLRNYAILILLAGLGARRWGRASPLRTVLLVGGAACVAYAAVRLCWTLWERPRPEEMLGTPPANGHAWSPYPSFPSGHVAVTTAIVTAMARLLPPARTILWGYAAVIAWTRLSFGAHFPTDVVAGLLLGWLAAVVTVTPLTRRLGIGRLRKPSPRRLRRAARSGATAALLAFGLLFVVAGVPTARDGGFVAGGPAIAAQVGLLAVAALSLLAARRHDAFGAPLILAGAALGIFAAVEYTPGFAGLAFLALAVPGTLFLLAWDQVPRLGVGLFVTAVAVGGILAAVGVHTRLYGPAHDQSSTPAAPSAPIAWAWAGGVTTDGVTVTARLAADGPARLVVGTGPELRGARTSAPQEAGADNRRVVSFRMDGLRADTAYHYAISVAGRIDRRRVAALRTFPAGRASFTFAAGSCARLGSNGAVFDAIRRTGSRFMLIGGDFFYANIDDPAPARYLDAYSRALEQPAQAALYRSTPIAYTWDDHDFGADGADRTSPTRAVARASYDDLVPHYPLDPRGDRTIHQAFTAGRVRFVVLDARSARSPASAPDDARKTMLGAHQKAWLKRELLAAQDRASLTVVASSVPWIAPRRAGDDGWGGYSTERAELSRFIAEHRIRNVLMVAGDAHMVAVDDGSNSDYSGTGRAGFPVLHAAALDRPGRVKGGPYSEGAYPGAGQFATVRVDDGPSGTRVALTGLDHTGRVLVRHRFAVPGRGR